ncbi:uncharacterized protein ASCRUDRAFT_135153 [Ascoidea rubescens DSM 1968]|uniref:Uncharacterized protein n=1 Tax=Ascoidea rubescens DSM 1968 TaxID=1344418 RepID=A0A1D2VLH0_9ASCO|nr:hypothetical protein ASCRUDRAFT_135153 [Ascoidea rubescens DSM 1968]ODV62456.1 hypothetical protein ASCRUDRAFT_135153 [Ascoidea rubescens DSM 1968]
MWQSINCKTRSGILVTQGCSGDKRCADKQFCHTPCRNTINTHLSSTPRASSLPNRLLERETKKFLMPF